MSASIQSGLLTPGILVAATAAEVALYSVGAQYPDVRAERPAVPAGGSYPVPQTSGFGPYNYVPGFIPLGGATAGTITGGTLSVARADIDSQATVVGTVLTSAIDFSAANSATLSYDTVNQNYTGVIGNALAGGATIVSAPAAVGGTTVGLVLNNTGLNSKYMKFQVITERAVPNGLFPQGTQGTQFPTPTRSTFLNTEADLVCDLVLLSAAGVLKDVIKPYIFRNMENLSDRGANRFAGMYEFLYPLHNASGVAGALTNYVAGDVIAVRLSHPVSPKAGITAPQGRFRVYLNAISN
jgi:hypothetical protein